jgi:predicted secreted hydrolase
VLAAAVAADAALGAGGPPFDPMNARDAETFPRAHGAHPGAALEWWYTTGIVRDAERRRLGFQLTFFRARLGDRPRGASAWRPGDLYFAHFAISDLGARFFRFDERAGRTSVALAGADSTDLNVRIRDWTMRRNADGSIQIKAAGTVGTLDLTLTPPRAIPVKWGPQYRSDKSADGRAYSRYQSYPRLRAAGAYVSVGDTARSVSGSAWFDHEWSDGASDPSMVGWDWFGLRIGDGRSLMLYRMRRLDGGTAHLFGGLVDSRGIVRALSSAEVALAPIRYWTSPRSGARYPISWKITLAPAGEPPLSLELEAALSDQELDTGKSTRVTYWEGVVDGRATQDEASERVEGYMELTGYAGGGVPGPLSTSVPPGR